MKWIEGKGNKRGPRKRQTSQRRIGRKEKERRKGKEENKQEV